ncbi:hypothetical protein [Methanosphaera sp. WGK6]|uniref:hypothetical protein n=1 Tax=Methanosphaera sp. WGK6 TaxID=1561964 RepID=UPI00084BE341|nr:hypothetical protein [Methanosphaera sp. WGK6]OED30384.1 hypothetical protein NL43_03150 [Methanosphaera sp. WGK6]
MDDKNIIIACIIILCIAGWISYFIISLNTNNDEYSTINQQNRVEYTYLEDDQIISKINGEPVLEYKGLTDYHTKSGWYTTDSKGNIIKMSDTYDLLSFLKI